MYVFSFAVVDSACLPVVYHPYVVEGVFVSSPSLLVHSFVVDSNVAFLIVHLGVVIVDVVPLL